MRMGAVGVVALVVGGLAAQTGSSGQSSQSVEIQGIRASLERLEASQGTLVVLGRIQIDEARLDRLEAQRERLLAEERALEGEAGAAPGTSATVDSSGRQAAVRDSEHGQVLVAVRDAGDSGPGAEAQRRLQSVRQSRATLDQRIARLRQRIAGWEQQLDPRLR